MRVDQGDRLRNSFLQEIPNFPQYRHVQLIVFPSTPVGTGCRRTELEQLLCKPLWPHDRVSLRVLQEKEVGYKRETASNRFAQCLKSTFFIVCGKQLVKRSCKGSRGFHVPNVIHIPPVHKVLLVVPAFWYDAEGVARSLEDSFAILYTRIAPGNSLHDVLSLFGNIILVPFTAGEFARGKGKRCGIAFTVILLRKDTFNGMKAVFSFIRLNVYPDSLWTRQADLMAEGVLQLVPFFAITDRYLLLIAQFLLAHTLCRNAEPLVQRVKTIPGIPCFLIHDYG